jgi:hypothetical protein
MSVPSAIPTKTLKAYASSIKSVKDQHWKRTTGTLDSTAILEWAEEAPPETACWGFDGGVHTIKMFKGLPGHIDRTDLLAKRRTGPASRKETAYLKAVHDHETMHGLYTSRDFVSLNKLLADAKVPFQTMNLFEDGRGESLYRSRRPTSVAGKKDLHYDGTRIESESYGIRKFNWLKWEEIHVDIPFNTMLAFIKAEGTRKGGARGDNVAYVFEEFNSRWLGDRTPWESKKTGNKVGIDLVYTFWRNVAGRGNDARYPTTESLLPVLIEWEKHFPSPEGGEGIRFGPGSDFATSADNALGGEAYQKDEPAEGKPTDKKETIQGKHDEKQGSDDESQLKTNKDLRDRGLSPYYFSFDN